MWWLGVLTSAWGAERCAGLEAELAALDAGQVTTGWWQLSARARQTGQEECARRALASRDLPPWLARPPVHPAPLAGAGGKATRDAYRVPNAAESENFALRWGWGVDEGDAEALLAAFEQSWRVEIEEMGYPAPYGSDSHKFNVYIGGSGWGSPETGGSVGYYYHDDEGWPMIVVSYGALSDPEGFGASVAAHEFFHAVQAATGNYVYDGAAAWFWEASATWAQDEVFPHNPHYTRFLFSFSWLPHYPVDFFDDEGVSPWGYYQYGAFVFVRYLSEYRGGRELVRAAWLEPTPSGDPLDAIERELRAGGSGVGLADAHADFAARNVTWDYQDGELYQAVHELYCYHHHDDPRISAEVTGDSGGWLSSGNTPPRRYGTNYLVLHPDPEAAPGEAPDIEVRFAGDRTGSLTSAASWSAWLVVPGDPVRYHPLDVAEDGTAGAWIEDIEGAWLVISASSALRREGETFSYRYAITRGLAPELPEDTGVEGSDTGGLGGDPGEDTGGTGAEERLRPEPVARGCRGARGLLLLPAVALGAAGRVRRRQGRKQPTVS